MRRKTITLLLALAAVLVVSAAPAMAQDRADRIEDRLEERAERLDGFFFVDEDRFDDGFFFDDDLFFDGFDDGVVQESEQEVESGDADQAFDVEGGGDDSNQTLGLQGVNNTGNAVSNLGVTQVGNDDAEVEVEDTGNFSISPDLAIESDQQVNQSAAASGR